jgi:hypothetical protein
LHEHLEGANPLYHALFVCRHGDALGPEDVNVQGEPLPKHSADDGGVNADLEEGNGAGRPFTQERTAKVVEVRARIAVGRSHHSPSPMRIRRATGDSGVMPLIDQAPSGPSRFTSRAIFLRECVA